MLYLKLALRFLEHPDKKQQFHELQHNSEIWALKWGRSLWTQNRTGVEFLKVGCVTSEDSEFESKTQQRTVVEMEEEKELSKLKWHYKLQITS